MKLVLASVLALSMSSSLFAKDKASHPCKEIKSACEAAGFTKGGAKDKKGLYKDCIQPLSKGQKVEGVNLDEKVLEACKVKKEKRKAIQADRVQDIESK